MTVAVIVGMKSEAALVPAGAAVACAGGIAARAEALARQALAEGASGLISVGIAGGLDPVLKPGDIIIGSGVELADGVIESDPAWRDRLLALLAGARAGLVYGNGEVAATPEHKRALFRRHGAVIVDMESGAVARVAAAAGKPFACLRAVSDPASRALPRSALVGLGPDGDTRPLAVMAALLLRPRDLPGLIRVGLDSKAGLSALGDALKVVGPTLGV
ncbi:MAG: nucleoside phosphorylase [Magnetospirillum sp.]|nr:MAG: nucleoside phosphorylase [Magnetospirillum sp.]